MHFISTETPFRLGEFQAGLAFHQVLTPTYPLFREPQYLLSLANKIVQVAREFSLDIIHAHYAVPHATAAFLSRQVLASTGGAAPRVVTTLHGTDITLVGNDPSYSRDRRVLDRAVGPRDGGVGEPARRRRTRSWASRATSRSSPISSTAAIHRRRAAPALRKRFTGGDPTREDRRRTSRTSGR